MTVGIFDSGMGGLSVLALAHKMMPDVNFIYYGDSFNAPYGVKSVEEVVQLSIRICEFLVSEGVDAIVVACNTATSAAIDVLREKYAIPIIGMEPAVKPAVINNCGKGIAVMATPMTLREAKFKKLIKRISIQQKIYEIPAPKIVELVEAGITTGPIMTGVIQSYFKGIPFGSLESIVLGCTHFLFVKPVIMDVFGPDVQVYDGNEGTVLQLIRKTNYKKNSSINGKLSFYNSGGEVYIEKSKKLFESYEVISGN